MLIKDNEKAISLRKKGNELYKDKKFFDALLRYNESLCYAEPSSEHLGFAYANRSAVYFELKLFNKCLENIEMAIKNKYPESSMEILSARKKKCENNLKNSQEPKNNFFKLSIKPNAKLPQIATSLHLAENETFGRHITTSRKLAVGEIIAIEKPFACVPIYKSNSLESNRFQRCNSCLRDNILDLVPCERCSEAMFCSQECYKNATESFHKYECKVMQQVSAHANLNIVLRLFFIGFSLFNEDINELYEFYEETLKNPKTIFDFDFSSGESEKEKFSALLSLCKSEKDFNVTTHIDVLKNIENFDGTLKENREKVENILQTICKISNHNFYGFHSANLQSPGGNSQEDLQQVVGSSANLFSSMMNHSCCPNIARVNYDGKVVVVVCKPVDIGEQIFDCYKVNFLVEQKANRQKRLKEEFNFDCTCVACTNDWPTANAKEMKIKNQNLLNLLTKSRSDSEKSFKELSGVLNKEKENYPSRELCMIQKLCMISLLKLTAPKVFVT